ncbi:hypothetical protein ES332_A03G123600v1 [Gossypium tomentosum]|uniref:Uncharacterized protein n=1 Tax=Gossypium tomentosum TaxID=34277 RepID=A0A5D2R658_GOSTO|nr:hypothetical protein ES332_A03G123600v1 [Gossypium tomentosum]
MACDGVQTDCYLAQTLLGFVKVEGIAHVEIFGLHWDKEHKPYSVMSIFHHSYWCKILNRTVCDWRSLIELPCEC